MKPFLDCDMFSLFEDDNGFYLIYRIYRYNSLSDNFNNNVDKDNLGCYQIPDFKIKNLHLLKTVDFQKIAKLIIPVIRKDDNDNWEVDLSKYYEENNIN
jgi:hypothetical protein